MFSARGTGLATRDDRSRASHGASLGTVADAPLGASCARVRYPKYGNTMNDFRCVPVAKMRKLFPSDSILVQTVCD